MRLLSFLPPFTTGICFYSFPGNYKRSAGKCQPAGAGNRRKKAASFEPAKDIGGRSKEPNSRSKRYVGKPPIHPGPAYSIRKNGFTRRTYCRYCTRDSKSFKFYKQFLRGKYR